MKTSQTGSGLTPNIASFLCYLCSPFTGIIFILIERQNKEVQFHAWQSVFLGGALVFGHLFIWFMMIVIGGISFFGMLLGLIEPLITLAFITLLIVGMIQSYQGVHFKIPVLGDLAEKRVE